MKNKCLLSASYPNTVYHICRKRCSLNEWTYCNHNNILCILRLISILYYYFILFFCSSLPHVLQRWPTKSAVWKNSEATRQIFRHKTNIFLDNSIYCNKAHMRTTFVTLTHLLSFWWTALMHLANYYRKPQKSLGISR